MYGTPKEAWETVSFSESSYISILTLCLCAHSSSLTYILFSRHPRHGGGRRVGNWKLATWERESLKTRNIFLIKKPLLKTIAHKRTLLPWNKKYKYKNKGKFNSTISWNLPLNFCTTSSLSSFWNKGHGLRAVKPSSLFPCFANTLVSSSSSSQTSSRSPSFTFFAPYGKIRKQATLGAKFDQTCKHYFW